MGHSTLLDPGQKIPPSRSSWPEWFQNDPRWQVAQRVVASQQFVRSRLLAKFLLYIVAETLEDRKGNITEHRIGVHVFDRAPSYSSIEDNIVRTYARQLRRRLAEYFAGEGVGEPLYIDIPLGGYVPAFVPAPSAGAPAQEKEASRRPSIRGALPELPERLTAATTHLRANWKRWLLTSSWLAAYSLVLGCLVWLVAVRRGEPHPVPPPAQPTTPLWSALFGGPANCYIVPADAGINLLEDLTRRPLPLAYYMNGSYLNLPLPQVDAHSADDLRGQQFTSFIDMQTVSALTRLPEYNSQRVILRFPRDVQLDDLKDANDVILGAMGSNPWAAIAQSGGNFRIVSSKDMQSDMLINMKPQPGEAASYVSHWNQPAHETFSVIAYLPNLSGSGHLLLLQGLDVAGTQAAAEALLHPDVIAPILRKATRRDGSLRAFEILLRSTSLESNATNTEVIGSRIY
ncbi:MAG: hypothetical protein ACLGRW_12900 [Acidobacteriota bacterium]